MQETQGKNSAILFQNTKNTVFLIDTPYSITLAQDWVPTTTQQEHHHHPQAAPNSIIETKQQPTKHLLSIPPLRAPYPASTEPKSDAARAKVLSRVPDSERRFHGEILPLVKRALEEIRYVYSSPSRAWCLPRSVLDDDDSSLKRRLKRSQSEYASDPPERDESVLDAHTAFGEPPLILSSTAPNTFESLSDLRGVVKNPSSEPAIVRINGYRNDERKSVSSSEYTVPPKSSFVLCTVPLSPSGDNQISTSLENTIPGLSTNHKFNLILLDPPWPNRSVRRSGHYHTHAYFAMSSLTQRIQDILQVYSYRHCDDNDNQKPTQSRRSIAAIWVTNAPKSRKAAYDSLSGAGFRVCEEWIWVKTTSDGQPISPLDGLWRKPYEILVLGEKAGSAAGNELGEKVTRRVIAAVPDLHSRKPNLKTVFEKLFFTLSSTPEPVSEPYSALEVFARNLSAGWFACGNEVLKFNAREFWEDVLRHN